jgi:EAL and modified HD-GYP domain-containing signal transduction protein
MSQQETTLFRQPILNRQKAIMGYEMLFHNLNPDDLPNIEALRYIHERYDLSSLAGDSNIFLPADLVELSVDVPALLKDPSQLIIEVTTRVAGDVQALRLLKAIRMTGAFLSLKNYDGSELANRVANACQYAKIDTRAYTSNQLLVMLSQLHGKGLKVIADRVRGEAEFETLKESGFDFFQGFFFTNPVVLHENTLSANKLSLLQLLASVNNENTEFHHLAEIISHDVALTHKLLTAINHPQHNLPIRVTSIEDAIRFMGLKRLKLWVNMILMSEVDDKPVALMETSLVRAKFCELLAQNANLEFEKDSYFLVGLFSTLGAYFNLPLVEVLKDLPIADHLKAAIIDNSGNIGYALSIAKQFESPYVDLMSIIFEDLDVMTISDLYLQASHWGHDVLETTARTLTI